MALLAFVAVAAVRAASPAPGEPVRVGVLTDNFPLSFRDEHGEVTGFAYELTREIERVMGLRFERMVGTTAEVNGAFAAGRLELVQSYAQFPEREPDVDFSVPYLTLSGAIFARRGLPEIRSMEDLRGWRVLVHRGSMGEAILLRAGLADSIVHVPSVEAALRMLEAGEGEATLVTRLTGLASVHQLGLKQVRALDVPVPDYNVRYCLAVQEGNGALLAKVNEGLAVLVRVGTFDRIYRRWFGHIEPTKYSLQQIALAVAGGLAVALLVALWAVVHLNRLRRRIGRQADSLRISKERYRAVFDGAHDGLLVLRVESGTESWLVEQLNPAARRMLDSRDDARTVPAWFGREPELARRIAQVATDRGTAEFEHELGANDQCWRVSVSPLGEGALVRLSDISAAAQDRRRQQEQEAQRRHSQKLEAIGTLAGGVAHDFNNLLSVIMGNADLALMEVRPDSPEADNLRKVLGASRRARQLVRQVLTFSRRTEPSREVLAVSPVVAEMLGFLRTLAHDTVEFEHRQTNELPDIVADTAQLHQVLMNVGTNAVQAMRGSRGRLTVTEELVDVGEEVRAQHPQVKAGHYVRIGFQDTGPGIAPETLARIFEPYFTTKGPGEGTGLGLSVVHGIMELHGGAVTVYSQPGRGTLFHLYFPVAAGRPADDLDERAVPRGRGARVLLVDDDDGVRRTAQQILERLDYVVNQHGRPEEALAEFQRNPEHFAVVVTDLAMPGLSGLVLAERIRRIRCGMPVVVMSGFFSPVEEMGMEAVGVGDRLHKPLTYGSVARVVAAAVRSGRPQPAG